MIMSDEDELFKAEERLKQIKLQHNISSIKGSKFVGTIDALSIAIDLVSSIIVGLLFGFWLDKIFDSKPICIIIFALVGSLAGAKIIWQKLNIKNK